MQVKGKLTRVFDTNGRAAAGFGQFCVIDLGKVACRRVGAELHRFRIALESEDAIVEDDDRNRKLHPHHGLKLGPAVGKAAVTDDRNDRLARSGNLGPDCERHTPTEPCKPAWRDKAHSARSRSQLTQNPHGRVVASATTVTSSVSRS